MDIINQPCHSCTRADQRPYDTQQDNHKSAFSPFAVLSSSNAEIDYVYQYNDKVIPIEVKAGKTGSLKSLHSYVYHNDCDFAIRLYSGELSLEDAITPGISGTPGKPFKLLNLPLYCAGQIEKYLDWVV